MSIELDINKPEIPLKLVYSHISWGIKGTCKHTNVPIPDEFKNFIEKNSDDDGFDWECRLLLAAETMDIALLKRWVDIMPSIFGRWQLKEIYNRRTGEVK